MGFGAREILQHGTPALGICGAQIHLDAFVENKRRLCLAAQDKPFDTGPACQVVNGGCRGMCLGHNVEIAHRIAAPAKAACDFEPGNIGAGAEIGA